MTASWINRLPMPEETPVMIAMIKSGVQSWPPKFTIGTRPERSFIGT
jgi:hypothetical protein